MKEMRFDVGCVRECLVREGKVYTVRGYYLYEGDVVVDGVGVCYRSRLGEVVRKEDLGRYVGLSGFKSVDEWWKVIRRFVKDDRKLWLYVVRVSNGRRV